MKPTQILKVSVLPKQIGTKTLGICTLTLRAPAPLKKGYPYKPSTYGQHLRKCRLDNGYTQFEASLAKPNFENRKKIEEFIGFQLR